MEDGIVFVRGPVRNWKFSSHLFGQIVSHFLFSYVRQASVLATSLYSRHTFCSQSLQHLPERNLVTLKIEAAPYSETPENTYDRTLCNNPEDYHLTRALREVLNIYIMSYYLLLHRCHPLGCSVRRNAFVNQDHLPPNHYLFNIHDILPHHPLLHDVKRQQVKAKN
jgi:hypothetical protein